MTARDLLNELIEIEWTIGLDEMDLEWIEIEINDYGYKEARIRILNREAC